MNTTDCFEYYNSQPDMVKNVSVIVGNGFDLSVFNLLDKGQTTSFVDFYYYLRSCGVDNTNILVGKMQENKNLNLENWCNFEDAVEELVVSGSGVHDKINKDLRELQSRFAEYLDIIITPQLVNALDQQAQNLHWSYRTLAQFTADLTREQLGELKFLKNLEHKQIFNFDIFNLNYTSLLDIYLHLDKEQFNPYSYKTTDRDFEFRINPRNYPVGFANAETGLVGYLMTEIHHPHGRQSIPRSLLFGTGSESVRDNFAKSHWAQLDRRYGKVLDKSQLFIVFGAALGRTDRWWWTKIANALVADSGCAELLIYNWVPGAKVEDIREYFFEEFVSKVVCDKVGSSVENLNLDDELRRVKERIFIVNYSDSAKISAFGFKTSIYDPHCRTPEV